MPEGAKERGVGLSGTMECVANVEKLIFEKLNARRVTSLAPSPAEVGSDGCDRLRCERAFLSLFFCLCGREGQAVCHVACIDQDLWQESCKEKNGHEMLFVLCGWAMVAYCCFRVGCSFACV